MAKTDLDCECGGKAEAQEDTGLYRVRCPFCLKQTIEFGTKNRAILEWLILNDPNRDKAISRNKTRF